MYNLSLLLVDRNVCCSAEEMYQVRCAAQVDDTYRHWIYLFLIQRPSAIIWHVYFL